MSEDDAENAGRKRRKHARQPVGYKKAPVEHRFAPGQSGNPKGSSRRRRDAAAAGRYLSNPSQVALLNEADRVVTVRENGQEVQMTMRELTTRRLMLDASKGGATATRLLSQLLGAAEAGKRKEIEENVKFIVRRQNIWRKGRRRLAEDRPRLGVDVRQRACGVANADVRWSVA